LNFENFIEELAGIGFNHRIDKFSNRVLKKVIFGILPYNENYVFSTKEVPYSTDFVKKYFNILTMALDQLDYNNILKYLYKINLWIEKKLDIFFYEDIWFVNTIYSFIANSSKLPNFDITEGIITKSFINTLFKDISMNYYRIILDWKSYIR
jgi:hypothetical protein